MCTSIPCCTYKLSVLLQSWIFILCAWYYPLQWEWGLLCRTLQLKKRNLQILNLLHQKKIKKKKTAGPNWLRAMFGRKLESYSIETVWTYEEGWIFCYLAWSPVGLGVCWPPVPNSCRWLRDAFFGTKFNLISKQKATFWTFNLESSKTDHILPLQSVFFQSERNDRIGSVHESCPNDDVAPVSQSIKLLSEMFKFAQSTFMVAFNAMVEPFPYWKSHNGSSTEQ